MPQVAEQTAISDPETFRKLAIIKELQRRQREEKGSFYHPYAKQLAFHQCQKKYRLVHGGNRSGKTESLCMDFHWCASDSHPYRPVRPAPTHYVLCGDGMTEQVDRVLVQKFRQNVSRETLRGGDWSKAWSEKYHTLHYANGSTIHFMSYDQDIGKLSGVSLDGAGLDESCNASKRFWQEINARLIDRNGFAVFAVTPIYGMTWEYEFYARAGNNDPDVASFRLLTKDNIDNLSEDGIRALEEHIGEDEIQRRVRLEGDFLSIGGLIYPMLNSKTHRRTKKEVGWDDTWTKYVAIDPGVAKEHAVLWGAIGPGRHVHFYRELAVSGAIHPDLKARIRTASGLDRIEGFRIDGHWDWDNRTARSAADGEKYLNLEREFYIAPEMPVIKAPIDNSGRSFGIDKVRDALRPDAITGMPFITFEPELERTWEEMVNYQYLDPKDSAESRHNPRVRKVRDDFPDCVRIFITSDLQYTGGYVFLPKSAVEVDEYGVAW